MVIKNIVSSVAEITNNTSALSVMTTASRLGTYVLEGIKINVKNVNNERDDFRIPLDGASPGTGITEGWVSFYMYYDSNSSNWDHDIFVLRSPALDSILRFRKSINSTNVTWYWSTSSVGESNQAGVAPTTGLHRYDISWKIASDSTGYFQVFEDGVLVLYKTGQNNGRGSSLAYFGARYETGGSADRVYSAFISADEDTSDINVTLQYPDAAGSSSAMTGAYTDIDETGYNASDYVYATSSGQLSLFGFPDVPAGPASENVVAVAVRMVGYGKTHGIDLYVRSGSTNYNQGEKIAPNAYKQSTLDILANDPNTSSAWTISNVNSSEIGFSS